MTQVRLSREKSRSRRMLGNATFTTVASRMTMSCATQITARARPPLRGACDGAASVMGRLRVVGREGTCRETEHGDKDAADELLGVHAASGLAGHERSLQHE